MGLDSGLREDGDERALDRATIDFPRILGKKESEKLLKYVAENLPGNISYQLEYHNNFVHSPEGFVEDSGSFSFNGRVSYLENNRAFDGFQSKQSKDNYSKVSGIVFNAIPGYSLRAHRQEVVDLWDNVRGVVEEYFGKRLTNL